ncbi:DUF4349 domain-containing protein [Isoptericola sp. b490]|uniref:DUF4349 domain-containing protein n=1 Tax=Actinotalea lenta TaxID=3064654 RepID=UPI002712F048|nr:DUF4349 domain-containing protein [Isoptericola sp. b490]MDO8121186.1 DUF4349 domain-containing protein [Isoptericola sp. b490]
MQTSAAPRRRMRRRATAPAVVAAVVAGLLAGCTASSGASADSASVAGESGSRADGGAAPAKPAGTADTSAGQPAQAPAGDRQMIVTGFVTVVVDDPIEKASRVVTAVERRGGYVSARDQQSAGEGRKPYAQITVRVPATRLSEVLDDLSTLGTVEESRLESVEVTAQARDLDARIAATKISIARLQGLLERSATLSDIVEAEQVLTDRQTQLEQLQSQRSALADQVAMSTLTVNLYTDAAVPDEPPSGFLSGLAAGWKALVAFGTGALSVTGVLLPWLAVLGVLILALWPAVRRARRRRAARAAQRAVAAPTGPHPDLGARPAPGAPGPDDGSSGPLPER